MARAIHTDSFFSDTSPRTAIPGRYLFLLALLFAFLNLKNQLYAQEQMVIDTITLKELTVTGKRPSRNEKTLQPIQYISGKELELIPTQTQAEAIKIFPGVTLKDYGGIGGLKTVNVRSLGANHTAVIIDGVQLCDVATGQIDLSRIPAGRYERVSLYIGELGNDFRTARSAASANVVELQSPKPNFEQKNYNISAGVKTGSFGLIKPHAQIQTQWTPTVNTDLGLWYNNAHGKYKYRINYGTTLDSVFDRQNSDIETLNLNLVLRLKPDSSNHIDFQTNYYHSERGLPGAVILYNPFSEQHLWNRDFYANIRYRKFNTTRFSQQLLMKLSQNFLRYQDPNFLNTIGGIDNRYTQREIYSSYVANIIINQKFKTSVAADYIFHWLNTNLPLWSIPTRQTIILAPSASFSQNNFESSATLVTNYIVSRKDNHTSSLTRLNPTLLAAYSFSEQHSTKIKILYQNTFRAPTFNDLYYTLVGNPNLRPEKAQQINVGISTQPAWFELSNLTFQTDVFYNRIQDKIVAIPTKNLFEWSMQNIGEVEIFGVSFQTSIKQAFTRNISVGISGNYSYQQAYDITNPNSPSYRNQIPYTPFEIASVQSFFTFGAWNLGSSTLFNGFCYTLAQNQFDNMLPAWTVTDISILWQPTKLKIPLKLKTEITNITNKQYQVIRSFPMPGRAYFLSLEIQI